MRPLLRPHFITEHVEPRMPSAQQPPHHHIAASLTSSRLDCTRLR
jgi:hypothetical protein